jgi:hypothetical protein
MKRLILTGVLLASMASFQTAFSEEESYVYDAHSKRDPLWPLVTTAGSIVNYDKNLSVTDLNLEGIMTSGTERIALMNGRIVKVNDKIGDYVIVQIMVNSVVLQSNGQTFSLILKKEGHDE